MRNVQRWGWSLGLVLGLLTGLPGSAAAQEKGDHGQKIYQQTLKGTVWILRLAREEGSVITGSGAFVHRDSKYGYIVTNFHVVGEASNVRLFFPVYNNKKELLADRTSYFQLMRNNRHIEGTVIHRKTSADLAVIRIPAAAIPSTAAVIPLAQTSPKPAEDVHSVGSPGAVGALWIYTPGKVRTVYLAELRSKLEENFILEIKAWMILTNSATNEGDSGGPLVNDKGHLIGITQGGSTRAQAVSTFVDIREVKQVLKEAKVPFKVATGKETARKDSNDSGDGDGGGDADTKNDAASNSKPTPRSDKDKVEDEKVAKLVKELIDARITERTAVLEKFQSTRGVDYTTALATAIPRLSGSYRDKARSALAARLERMTVNTLKNYLEDESPELRRGAVRAIGGKEAKELMKDLVPLLTDSVSDVADEAYEVLCKMTGQDLGRSPDKWKKFLAK